MTSIIQTASALEPFTVDEAKLWLRITNDSEDTVVRELITLARRFCERQSGFQFFTATYSLKFECFKREVIYLPNPPLQSVSFIKYYDTDNALQTLDAASYIVDSTNRPGSIEIIDVWPSTYDREDAIEVQYTAGFESIDDLRDDSPELMHAARIIMAHFYENRQEVITTGSANTVPLMALDLLNRHRIPAF